MTPPPVERQARRFGIPDVIAGISVALVLIPQSLAYAEIAGLPSYIGLFAAALPPIAAALFASSPYLQTGPVAMTSLLTFGALAGLAPLGSPEYIGLAALLALIVGVVRLILGWIKAGVVAYLMSQPVLIGFTSAAAILIGASQLPKALGAPGGDGSLLSEAFEAIIHPASWNLTAVSISVVSLVLVIAGRRAHALFPGVLVAVIAGIVFVRLAGYDGSVVGHVPTGLPPFSLALPWHSAVDLIVPGIIIALVGFAEPAAIARTLATQDRTSWNPHREFISQGVANLAAGISGAFPVGGSFSRSSINKMAGGRTRWAGAITGLAVFAFLPFANLVETLPEAVLGAIVIAGVYRLVRIPTLVKMWRYSHLQAAVAWTTFLLTLWMAPRIDQAIIIGILVGIAVHLWRELAIDVHSWIEADAVHIKPRGVLYFGSAPILGDTLIAEFAAHPEAQRLVIDLQSLGRIDYTGALALRQAALDAESAGVSVSLAGVPDHSRQTLTRVWESPLPEESPADPRSGT